jgi:ketosteroid isomerase-like protein
MILPLMLLVFAACQPATMELTEEQKATIADAVREANADYWAAWARMEDFDEYAGHYSDRSVFFPLVDAESREAHRSVVMGLWSRLNAWEVQEMPQPDVLVLGADGAFLEGSAVSLLTDTTGATEEWVQTYSSVWVREESGWRMVATRFSTAVREPM